MLRAALVCAAPLFAIGVAGCSHHVYRIPSSAMEPTLHCARPGAGCEARLSDRVETESVSPGALRRGDIIIFETPKAAAEAACNASGTFIKRVIGLPGETVRERGGIVYVGGSRLDEPYLQPARRDDQFGTWSVPKGHYFLMGDNRRESCDSRRFGSVPFSSVIGRVTAIIRDGNKISVR